MELDSGLYKLVHEYYETRILYGYYAYGDRLPSIPAIASMFHLAPATVRSALSLLEQQGYVSLEPRRTAKVVYRSQPAKCREDAARYFLPRLEGIMDMVKSSQLLLAPFLEKGLAQWEEADWERLRQDLAHIQPGKAPFAVAYYLRAFRPLHNRLLFNLFWEMIRYIRLPYLADETGEELEGLDFQALTEDDLASHLNQRFLCSYERAMGRIADFSRRAAREYGLEEAKPIPFQWNIYRQRPQLRYTLVCWILREIIRGNYPPGSYLPSLPKLAERYGVSLNTVRRTLDILEELGIARAQQGKGVLVCIEPQPVDFTQPEIQEGMRLCQESLQLLSLTIQPVMRYTMESAPAERWKALAGRFARLRQEGKSYLCFDSCLGLVEEECPMAFIREVYSKARELLIWGYPFKVQRLKRSGLNREYEDILAAAEAHLEQGNLEAFAGDWGNLLAREEQLFQDYMQKNIR